MSIQNDVLKSSNLSKVRVTSVYLEHNHEVSAATFLSAEIGTEEAEVIANLQDANCKINKISSYFS